jgi:molybdopterin molybdotransferase
MISVQEALARILADLPLLPTEVVDLAHSAGRALAEDVVARVTQPPTDVSAMDGYAVRAADVAKPPARLTIIGEAAAGGGFQGSVGPGQTVRIFTGGPVPAGADAIVMQEDTEASDEHATVTVNESSAEGRHIRPAGLDFTAGQVGLTAGRALGARDVGLAAAMNVPWLSVRRKPRVALLATGDEIVRPGEPLGPNQIVSSNALALAALIEAGGAEAIDLGIARDDEASLRRLLAASKGVDMLVTLGGASVGEHDLVRQVLGEEGLLLDFWQIAMRPGKPLIFGRIGETVMLGMPGNPVSSLVCGLIFLRPALRRMLGLSTEDGLRQTATLGRALSANGQREHYMRAELVRRDGALVATPFEQQDSSMLSHFARAGCLVVRPPHAAAAAAGDRVEIVSLGHAGEGI